MRDLFGRKPQITPIDRTVGKGNALFLADLMAVVEKRLGMDDLRANIAARKYDHLNKPWAAQNVAFWGLV